MDIHKNARTTPHSRAELVRRISRGEKAVVVAMGFGVCEKTVRKWVARHAVEGGAGLRDRRSRPHRLRGPTAPALADQVLALRRQRWLMKGIAGQLGLSLATVSRLLKRAGLSRLNALEPPVAIQRYEYSAPGELLHFDTKKLGRFHRVGSRITGTHQKRSPGAGFEVAHICIDDHSRLAYAEVLSNERKETTAAFLNRALDHFETLGVAVARIMTDNGSSYRSYLIADLCRSRRLRHIFTRPYTPRGPTARPNASSKLLYESGPTQNPTPTALNAPPRCAIGSTTTTATALISASAAAPLSLASLRTTCCNSTVRLKEPPRCD